MGELGGDLGFAQEALPAERGRELGPQHLECHPTIELPIVGEIHHCHPAMAELTLDRVAVGEGSLQVIDHRYDSPDTRLMISPPCERQTLLPRRAVPVLGKGLVGRRLVERGHRHCVRVALDRLDEVTSRQGTRHKDRAQGAARPFHDTHDQSPPR
jgi:hypothetical protein